MLQTTDDPGAGMALTDASPRPRPLFRDLVVHLADRVGRQHIPVNDRADDIHDLLGADAVHHELIKRIVRNVYKKNRCGHLDSIVDADNTFVTLGQIRSELTASQSSDIDQINLVDNIGEAAHRWFRVFDRNDDPRSGAGNDPGTTRIIQLSHVG